MTGDDSEFVAALQQYGESVGRVAEQARVLGLTLQQATKLSEAYFAVSDHDGRR